MVSITSTELYFEVDEDDEEFKKVDTEVRLIRFACKFLNNNAVNRNVHDLYEKYVYVQCVIIIAMPDYLRQRFPIN